MIAGLLLVIAVTTLWLIVRNGEKVVMTVLKRNLIQVAIMG